MENAVNNLYYENKSEQSWKLEILLMVFFFFFVLEIIFNCKEKNIYYISK